MRYIHLLLVFCLAWHVHGISKRDVSDEVWDGHISSLNESQMWLVYYNNWISPLQAGSLDVDEDGATWPPSPSGGEGVYELNNNVQLTFNVVCDATWNWYICHYSKAHAPDYYDERSALECEYLRCN